MIKVKISGPLITDWLTKGHQFRPAKVVDGLPEGCELVDAKVDGVVFQSPILTLFFEDESPEVTEKEIVVSTLETASTSGPEPPPNTEIRDGEGPEQAQPVS